MKKYIACIFALVSLVGCAITDDGMPYGKVTETDMASLTQFAKTQDLDLEVEGKKLYAKDKTALARIFRLSLAFKSLDRNARTYGQIVFSSLLNLGESMGVEQYAKVLSAQEPEVRQRVRDFLYYPLTRVSQKNRAQVEKETRSDYPELFPADYHFGENDPIFKK